MAWFAENVVCEPFVSTMKALFPDSVHEVIYSGRFTAEQRKTMHRPMYDARLLLHCGALAPQGGGDRAHATHAQAQAFGMGKAPCVVRVSWRVIRRARIGRPHLKGHITLF